MKYSILVLGASISIALFIRICCSLEANSDQELEMEDDLLSGTSDEVYEKALRMSLLNGAGKANTITDQEDHVDQMVRSVMQEIKLARKTPRLHQNPKKSEQIHPRHRSMSFNNELCGYTDPPELGINSCEDSDSANVWDWELPPEGCQYDEKNNILTCSNEQITNIPRRLPRYLAELKLHETGIKNVSENAFRNVTIRVIRLYRNSLDYIHPWAFHDVKNLTMLFITYNQIEYLPYELYVGLEDTTLIDLQYNLISFDIYRTCPLMPIDQIPLVLPKLSLMTLDGNPLNVIPSQMFAGLRESPLSVLSLRNCYLKEIDEGAFSYFKKLTTLDLSQNPSELITSVDKFAKAIQPLTSLFKIYLSDLNLPDFPTEALYYVRNQLKYMELKNNKFHTLKRNDLAQFPNLVELYLDDCHIQIIEIDAFAGNPKLEVLTLRNNEIRQLPTYFPPTLNSLAMSNIQLTQLGSPPVCFQNLPKLTALDMIKIKINKITNATFTGLSALDKIFIKDCNIESIENGSFKDLTNVRTMIIDDNPISEIRQETFIGLNNMINLSMRNCTLSLGSIIPSEDGLFKYAPKLKDLNMIDNSISSLANLFQNLRTRENLSELSYVRLNGNPIESWHQRLFPDQIATVYDTTNPTNFFELHISDGNIHFMKPEMLEDFLRVTKIDLSGNNLICDRGACDFKDLLNKSSSTSKQTWIKSENYKCKDSVTGTDYFITDLTDEICKRANIPEPSPSVASSSSSSTATTLITVIASLSLLTAVIIILAYRNRAHLRYFWFSFKFNVMPIGSRKAKISLMESESEFGSYDFDVFISYHHDDANFIEDVFLPEIEQQDERTIESEIVEARNTIYFIENDDEIVKRKNNINEKSSSKPRFKVCLHERDFAAGVPITENIVSCVDRSNKTVIFVSRKYMESQWCSYELNLAYHRLVESRRKSFVLVLMEDVPSESRGKVLSYLMVSQTYLQWPGENGTKEDKEAFWKRLRVFLKS